VDRLAGLLGPDLPREVVELPPDVRNRLAEQVERAQAAQAAHIAEAIDAAVHGVPLPVRGVVRKALLG
jgi:hypothetical protein